jgi:ABC-type antimicrobial peptide transport system permease subunit
MSAASKIAKLQKALNKGKISQEEFEAQKARLLNVDIAPQDTYGQSSQTTTAPKKNKKKKTVFALLAIIVVIIIIVVACSSGGGDNQSEENTSAASESIDESPDTVEAATPLSEEEITQMLSDADKFEGRSVVNLPGVVFNVMSESEKDYEYQCWADENSEYSFIMFSETNLSLAADDNVFVTGIIRGSFKGENAFGGEVSAAVIEVSSVEKSETSVFNLAEKIIEAGQTEEQHDVSVSLEKVELGKKSTRVYLKIENNTEDALSVYTFQSYIKQGKKQYDESDISYEENTLQTNINAGIESEGCLSFAPLDSFDEPFTFYLYIGSDNYDIEFEPFVFDVVVE